MADETSMALEELLRKAQLSDDVDFLREGVRVLAQALMDRAVSIGYSVMLLDTLDEMESARELYTSLGFEEGAALGLAYQTSHFALVERAVLAKGESVLVTGASGGVGLAGVEIAKALGATVLAGVTSPEKGELCRRHGADHVIDLSAPDLRNSLREQVYAAVGKRGVDIVLENVGGEVFDASLRALASASAFERPRRAAGRGASTGRWSRALICSVTPIDPSSAAMPDPTRPVIISAVSTGPISRRSEIPMIRLT